VGAADVVRHERLLSGMFIVRPFTSDALKLHPFTCGEPELDDWLAHYAGQSERRDNARTMLLLDEHEGRVAGYYTMLTFELSVEEAESALGRARRYPVPATLIARLAVDSDYKGRGLGRFLLVQALERLAAASADLGFEMVVVHALHEDAACFYLKHGFQRFADHSLGLFLTTKRLRATYAMSDSD
jgi:GNAT superfamily N-acetyltransferase